MRESGTTLRQQNCSGRRLRSKAQAGPGVSLRATSSGLFITFKCMNAASGPTSTQSLTPASWHPVHANRTVDAAAVPRLGQRLEISRKHDQAPQPAPHRCNPRMRDDEWPEQLSCIASREGTAALHFSGSSSSVRSLVQEHAVFKWALAHMAVPARSPISSARASSWRGRGRNRAPRFKSGPLEVYFIPARSLAHFSRTV